MYQDVGFLFNSEHIPKSSKGKGHLGVKMDESLTIGCKSHTMWSTRVLKVD